MSFWYPLAVPMFGEEEVAAATEVLKTQRTTMGERVEEFEEAFARQVGARYAVMVNSGSSADLLMAWAAHWIDPTPPRVLIPAVTWPTHVWSWVMAGFNVRLIDVGDLNTTQEIVTRALRSPHDMVSLVHLMGIPCDIKDLPCPVTEDCCEALGSDVGRLGSMATWSFFFSHHITTMEGGAVTTNDRLTASRLRSMRSHGWARHESRDPYTFIGPGLNVRPTEVAAAIGLVQLGRLDEFNKLRTANRAHFVDALYDCPGITFPHVDPGAAPAWFGLPFFVENRDALAAFLEHEGVETRPILGGNLIRQPAFEHWRSGPLPGADRIHDHGLFIGLHPVADCGIERVAQLIGEFLG